MSWCWHSWGKWLDIRSGKITDEKGAAIGRYIEQERRCTHCGKVQLRSEEIPKYDAEGRE